MPMQIFRSKPIEREYEAWLLCAIDAFLSPLGIQYDLWALTPREEQVFPADEKFRFNGKLIAFQMKRTYCLCGGRGTGHPRHCTQDDLYWELSSKRQLSRIKSISYIYYVLPAFLNRRLRQSILHATCFTTWFWRPHHWVTAGRLWNGLSRTRRTRLRTALGNSFTWNQLLASLCECNIGRLFRAETPVRSLLVSQVEGDRNGPASQLEGGADIPGAAWTRASTAYLALEDAAFNSVRKAVSNGGMQ